MLPVGNCVPISQVSTVFHFEGKQDERGTWACFTRKGSRELLGPAVKNPSLLTPFSPLRDAVGFLISQVVWTLFCVSKWGGRNSSGVDLPGRGSEGRERPCQHYPQTPAMSQVSLSGLPPLSVDWFMSSWQDDSLWWGGSQLNTQPPPFPRDLFLLLHPSAAQLRAQETKQSLLLRLKSFPWLIVPVVLLLTILPSPLPAPPPQSPLLLPPLPTSPLLSLILPLPYSLWFLIITLLKHDKPNRILPKREALGT